MAHQNETGKDEAAIVKSHMERLDNVPNSGVVMDLYEFTNDTKKAGFVFYVNKQERIKFGEGAGGSAKGSISGEKICANFLVTEEDVQEGMEDVMKLGSSLKHIGILKPMFVAYNCQISKLISSFGSYDQSFDAWLSHTNSRGKYLIPEEKEMLITACTAVYEMWNKGYTCDSLADRHSYVMIGARLKILPNRLRRRGDHENDIMPLRSNLADLIDVELRTPEPQLWCDPELQDFTTLLRNPNARLEDILGHPILLTPGRRQIMYRNYGTLGLTSNQVKICEREGLYNSSTMTINCPQKDDVCQAICTRHTFQQNSIGALDFASMISRHYVERLKKLMAELWVNILKDDTVDKVLRDAVPRLLTKRYGYGYVDGFNEF